MNLFNDNFKPVKIKKNSEEHRQGTIALYEDQLREAKELGLTFMPIVLKQAIRKLKLTGKYQMKPSKIEQWVVDLEKLYQKDLR